MRVEPTRIDGLLRVTLDVHGDPRGWFKESYSRAPLEALGLPRLDVLQHNVSYNEAAGVARGIHVEPWDKYVSPAHGRVFAAVVDVREGPAFGRVETMELGPADALLVPRGCGNSFVTLEPHTVYSYLVNGQYERGARYPAVDLFDEALAIDWPVPREAMVVSDKDLRNPALADLEPVRP